MFVFSTHYYFNSSALQDVSRLAVTARTLFTWDGETAEAFAPNSSRTKVSTSAICSSARPASEGIGTAFGPPKFWLATVTGPVKAWSRILTNRSGSPRTHSLPAKGG